MTAQSREHFWWFWTAIEIVFVSMFFVLFAQPALANDQKVQRLIQESIASYPGKCTCAYSLMSNGRKCGVEARTQSQAAIHHCVIQKMYTGDIHR